MSVEQAMCEVFESAGARGFVHVGEIGTARSVSLDGDTLVPVASVIKIVIAVAFGRAVSAGRIDPAERMEVPARYRIGGTGTAGCSDPVKMSVRDLAKFMMTMSDNAATDLVYQRVGQRAIDAVVNDLGLTSTYVRGDMEFGHSGVVAELGLDNAEDLDDKMLRAGEAVWGLALLDPLRANASTAREIGLLLEAVWTDRAAPPDACAFVRQVMSAQVTTHRLASGFDTEGVHVAGKTGTLPAVRNEAGVVSYPDGRRYVAVVFTKADTLNPRRPAVDASVGRAARLAVDNLRQRNA